MPTPLTLDSFSDHWYIYRIVGRVSTQLGGSMRKPGFIRRLIAVMAIAALAIGACSTGDDAGSDDDSSTSTSMSDDGTTEAPATTEGETEASSTTEQTPSTTDGADRTASFRGVTEDTIDIGVGFWDTTEFGFGFFGDTEAVWTALTDAVNERGGVNGRMLVPTVAGFSPANNEGMLEACIALTEDAEVFAVLGGMRGDANFCVSEQHETIHLGSQVFAGGEALERARAPIAGFFPVENTVEPALIEALDDQDWFDDATVGLHYESSDLADRLSENVQAALADVGVTVEIELVLDDLVVDDDTAESQIEIMQEQVRTAGITHMIMIGGAASGFVAYGESDIELAATEPNNFNTAIQQGIDPVDLDGTVAASTAVNLPDDPIDDKAQQCLDDVETALPDARFENPGPGVENTAGDPNYWSYTLLACRDLDLFVQAATAAGVELTNETFRTGLESLTDLSFAQMPFASFAPDKYNGNDTLRLVQFDGDADEDGELVPLGDPVDLTP